MRVTSLPRGLANVTEHFSGTPAAAAAARAAIAAVTAVRRDGVDVTTRWPPSPERRAGARTTKGKPWVSVFPNPGNPEGRRGWEELISFSRVAQPAVPRGGHSRPRPRRSPPELTTAEPEPKAKGAASPRTWRRVRGEVAALLQVRGAPLCDFTHFATSPGRRGPTHPGPPPRGPQPPPISALSALPRPPWLDLTPSSWSLLSRSSWLFARWPQAGGPARGGPRLPRRSQNSPSSRPAERRAFLAARCCAS